MNPIDKSNFRQIIIDSVKQLEADLEFLNQLYLARRQFNKILLCGMGGSALVGDLLYYLKTKKHSSFNLKIPIFVHRSYDLPPDIDTNTLIICISYSGDTEETISSYKKAKELDLEIAGITCGGKLEELFQQDKTPWVKISNNKIPPRSSLGYQLTALIKILAAYGLSSSSTQHDIIASAEKIKPEEMEESAKLFSQKLLNKIPIIYSSEENKAIARIWKIKFNENSKIPAFWNALPELNHNEIIGWSNQKPTDNFFFIFLSDQTDHPRIKKRIDLTIKILKQLKLPTETFELGGATPLETLFRAIIFGDWLSYYLALAYNVDPIPVALVEEFKQKLD